MQTLVAFLVCLVATCDAWFYGRPEPGAMTTGGVWPLPQHRTNGSLIHKIDPKSFQFIVAQVKTDFDNYTLTKAFSRYKKWTFPDYKGEASAETGTLTKLKVTVSTASQDYPYLNMDEQYALSISEVAEATIQANTVWGALRGLDTFSQLVYQPSPNIYRVQSTVIIDSPRFTHRGIMIDSSRHFLSLSVIKQNLDLMEQNKMNVMHWHLVDSESFPYSSTLFPNMTMGAYTPAHQYSVADIKEVIQYARMRGIRVIAEFDTPGHMGAWAKGNPDLLAKCYDSNGQNTILSNIVDPSKETNYDFLKNFFNESMHLFPDVYTHFGGDEITATQMQQCWLQNADISKWMQKMGFGTNTALALNYYINRLFTIVNELSEGKKSMLVWSELLDNKIDVAVDKLMAHVWIGGTYQQMMDAMKKVTALGHNTILSSCWYLNYIKYGADWGYVDNENKRLRGLYYECDPTGFDGTDAQKKLVLGGEATMWGEIVDGTNLIQRLWPRASAVAERLWSNAADTQDPDVAWPRLHEHRCRLMRRGFQAQPPNNPDYCPTFWNPEYANPDDYTPPKAA